jgi:hypothetical protein
MKRLIPLLLLAACTAATTTATGAPTSTNVETTSASPAVSGSIEEACQKLNSSEQAYRLWYTINLTPGSNNPLTEEEVETGVATACPDKLDLLVAIHAELGSEGPPATLPPTIAEVPLGPADFEIDLIVVDQACFGSAGCNITVEPDLTVSEAARNTTKSWFVTYQISGGEDLAIETITTDPDDDTYTYDQVFISTESSDYELVAEVTSVRENRNG